MKYTLLILGLIAVIAFMLAPQEEKAQMLGRETVKQEDSSSWVIRARKAQYFLRGEKGVFGIVEAPFKKGKEAVYTVYFWGKKEELTGKTLHITGTHSSTGKNVEEKTAILKDAPPSLAVAQGQIPLVFPDEGTWVLTVSVEGKKLGEVAVEVK